MSSTKTGGPKKRPAVIDPRQAERRRSILIRVGATAVVVIVAVAIGAWIIVSHNDKKKASGLTPTVTNSQGAFRVSGQANAKTTLTIVEDFQCPVCRQFESLFSDTLGKIRAMPDVAVDYLPLALLNQMSTDQYSTRSANASMCVAQATATRGDFATWLKFHTALYEQQPPEGGPGLSNSTLADIASKSGVPSVASCIDNGSYDTWLTNRTGKAAEDGIDGTPTLLLNGKKIQAETPDRLMAQVSAAVAK